MVKGRSTFMLKQRAFLKVYLISMAENERLYGLQYLDTMRDDFKRFNYKPNHSEVYKSLHELLENGTLKRVKEIKKGTKLQEVVYYAIDDWDKALYYKELLKEELHRCHNLLGKAIENIYKK